MLLYQLTYYLHLISHEVLEMALSGNVVSYVERLVKTGVGRDRIRNASSQTSRAAMKSSKRRGKCKERWTAVEALSSSFEGRHSSTRGNYSTTLH